MEDIILQRTTKQPAFEDHQGIEAHRAGSNLRTRLSSLKADSNLSWGRSHTGSLSTSLYCVSIMLLCPMLVVFSWIALEYFGGSLFAASWEALSLGPLDFALRYSPAFSWKATAGYMAWLFFQAALYTYLPGDLSTGQLTPAGYLLQYYTNGLLAWSVTHVAFGWAVLFAGLDAAIIAKHWSGLLIAVNVYGFVLSTFAYIKAHVAPSHAEDRKFSGKLGHMTSFTLLI
jgi:7-dehydrocholesterol reductase